MGQTPWLLTKVLLWGNRPPQSQNAALTVPLSACKVHPELSLPSPSSMQTTQGRDECMKCLPVSAGGGRRFISLVRLPAGQQDSHSVIPPPRRLATKSHQQPCMSIQDTAAFAHAREERRWCAAFQEVPWTTPPLRASCPLLWDIATSTSN